MILQAREDLFPIWMQERIVPQLFQWHLDLAEESPRVFCAAQHRSQKMFRLDHLAFGIGKGPGQVSGARLLIGQNYNTHIELNYLERTTARSSEESG